MAVDKYGKQLPKGMYYNKEGDFYLGRFQYQREKYSVTDKNLAICVRMLADKQYEVRHGLATKNINLTVDAWFPIWIKDCKESIVKKGTIEVYTRSYNLYVKPYIGKMKLQDVKKLHIQRIYNELKKEEFSMGTIEVASTVVSGIFKEAYKCEYITKNPVPLATLPKVEDEDDIVRAMSLEDQKLLNMLKIVGYIR